MPVDHYENFPVASWLLPKHLRAPVQHIYRFARCADDLADEGDHSPAWRLNALQRYAQQLDYIGAQQLTEKGQAELRPVFAPLEAVIRQYQLPLQPFYDLLSAFKQDICVKRYANYDELLDYCRRSADPVGRILLCLYQEQQADSLSMSDAVCTGLQLTNFWQDIAIDWDKNRVYLPQDELHRFALDETIISRQAQGERLSKTEQQQWQQLLQAQINYARQLLTQGKPLCHRLPGRIGFELRLIIQGGLRILEKLERVQFDMFRQRPIIRKRDSLLLLMRAFRN